MAPKCLDRPMVPGNGRLGRAWRQFQAPGRDPWGDGVCQPPVSRPRAGKLSGLAPGSGDRGNGFREGP